MSDQSARLQLSARTVLVSLETIRAARGCDAETIWADVDNGRLRFVFDMSERCKIRELRFWVKEIIAPEFTAQTTPDQAVAEILGARQGYRRGELEVQWVLSHVTIMRLIRVGQLTLAGSEVTRASLAAFLKSRLQGVQPA